jgi:hypothetical protein
MKAVELAAIVAVVNNAIEFKFIVKVADEAAVLVTAMFVTIVVVAAGVV